MVGLLDHILQVDEVVRNDLCDSWLWRQANKGSGAEGRKKDAIKRDPAEGIGHGRELSVCKLLRWG